MKLPILVPCTQKNNLFLHKHLKNKSKRNSKILFSFPYTNQKIIQSRRSGSTKRGANLPIPYFPYFSSSHFTPPTVFFSLTSITSLIIPSLTTPTSAPFTSPHFNYNPSTYHHYVPSPRFPSLPLLGKNIIRNSVKVKNFCILKINIIIMAQSISQKRYLLYNYF